MSTGSSNQTGRRCQRVLCGRPLPYAAPLAHYQTMYCSDFCRRQAWLERENGGTAPEGKPALEESGNPVESVVQHLSGGEAAFLRGRIKILEQQNLRLVKQRAAVETQAETYRIQLEGLRRSGATGAGLSPEEWEKLRQMSDTQLRQWVKVASTFVRNGHDSPLSNAIRWVEGNSLE